MGREVESSNEGEPHTREQESVEELQARQGQYSAWSSPDDPQQTLEHLTSSESHNLKSLDMSYIEMEGDIAKQIGEAVASHKALEVLTIKLDSTIDEEKFSSPTSVWPMDSFLTAAFLGPQQHRNSSVVSLIIAGSGTDGDLMRVGVLPQVIRENTHIRQLWFQWHGDDGASKGEMVDLLEALQVNSTIESLVLPSMVRWDFPNSEDQGFIDSETFTQIVKLVQDSKSIHKLEIQIGECRGGDTDVNLDAFYRALSSNTAIRSLRMRGQIYTEVAETEFSNWIRRTSTLTELDMQSDLEESPILKVLFGALGNNKSLRELRLEDFPTSDDEDVIEELLNALRVNSTMREIVFDPDSERGDEVREALKKNLEQ
ncbi:unnamed protein product [Calypogeia fissa]